MTSSEQNPPTRSGIEGLNPVNQETEAYDATRDPRTGRPPNPLEAQRLARAHEDEREESAVAEEDGLFDENPSPEDDFAGPDLSDEQEPARMASPKTDEQEKAAADALVQEGVTREQAEALVEEHGTNWETLKAAAFASDAVDKRDTRKEELALHHDKGIPPFEPPKREE